MSKKAREPNGESGRVGEKKNSFSHAAILTQIIYIVDDVREELTTPSSLSNHYTLRAKIV